MITHIDGSRIRDLLALFDRVLAERGVLVFTAHGEWVADRLKKGTQRYRLKEEAIHRLLALHARTGCGYAGYPEAEGYGISVTSPAWMRAELGRIRSFRELFLAERGWDDHQDVYAVSKG